MQVTKKYAKEWGQGKRGKEEGEERHRDTGQTQKEQAV